jgi:hypothetical protein
MSERPTRTAAFLKAYRICANVTQAAKAAGITREAHYKRLEADAKYRAAFERARIDAGQRLEDEAVERATKGVWEPLTYQGNFTYPEKWDEEKERFIPDLDKPPLGVWKKSDGLLMAMHKSFLPHRYGSRVEISGPEGGPISLETERLKALTDEELATLLALARKIQNTQDTTEQ